MSKLNATPRSLEEALEKIDEILIHFEKLQKENEALREENQRLKEQLNINSKNSSLPPSRDLKKTSKKGK